MLLVDTLGELMMFYAAADIAFVGGSLIATVGGHNLLEPAVLERPILVGPHNFNAPDIAQSDDRERRRTRGEFGRAAGCGDSGLSTPIRRRAPRWGRKPMQSWRQTVAR